VAVDPGEAGGSVVGYVIDRPMRLRDALAPLLEAFALDPVERRGGVALAGRSGLAALSLGDDDLAWPEDREAPVVAARAMSAPVQTLRLRFIDAARDYQTGSVVVRRERGGGERRSRRPAGAGRRRRPRRGRAPAGRRRSARGSPPTCRPWPPCAWSPGIAWSLDGTTWRVTRIDLDEHPRAQLAPVVDPVRVGGDLDWSPAAPREVSGPPVLHVLDLPLLKA
jgi:hypothetical protein